MNKNDWNRLLDLRLVIYILTQIKSKKSNCIQMNLIQMVAINFMEIKMLYLKMEMQVVSMQLRLKHFNLF